MTTKLVILSLLTWLAVVLYICNLLVKIWSQASRLSAIPNAHFSAPYSRLWLFLMKATDSEHDARETAHRLLGPVIRLAPNELSVSCIEDGVQTIYSGGFEKGGWYESFLNYGYIKHDF
jgi:hypothetical protein